MSPEFEKINGVSGPEQESFSLPGPSLETTVQKMKRYLWSFLIIAALTVPGFLLRQTLDTAAIAMFYLLALVGIAVWFGRGPAIASSVLGVLFLDYFINPPYFSFTISRFESWMTLFLMLVESLVISTLAARLKEQVTWAREREIFASLLSDLGPALAEDGDESLFTDRVERFLGQTVGAQVLVLLADGKEGFKPHENPEDHHMIREPGPALWCLQNGRKTGLGHGAYALSRILYLPLGAPPKAFGVLVFDLLEPPKAIPNRQLTRLEFFAEQTASALERNHLFQQVEDHRIQVENEKNRSALLSAVSHDLRTPLTAIEGAASSLMGDSGALNAELRLGLARMIFEESERMNRLVQNLLDMTRLQASAPQLKKEWQSMEELVGAILDRLKARLKNRPFSLDLQPYLPLVLADGLLVEQLLLNLLENALNHTPDGTAIRLSVKGTEGDIELEIADKGPGIKPGEEKAIFEKFIRGYHGGQGGAGLGLSICQAIVLAHGGSIEAQNIPEGGASFRVRLPTGGQPPFVSED